MITAMPDDSESIASKPSEQKQQVPLYDPEANAKERAKETIYKQKFDEVSNGLGRVCIEFQRLEGVIKSAISELVSKDDPFIGSIITAELRFQELKGLLYAAWKYHWEGIPDKVAALGKILDRCGRANTARNKLVHSEWFYDQKDFEGAMRIKTTAGTKKGLDTQNETFTPAMMQKVADELKSCGHELAQFIYDNRPIARRGPPRFYPPIQD